MWQAALASTAPPPEKSRAPSQNVIRVKDLPASLQAVLTDFDTDGDGSIDVSELQAAHHALSSARNKVRVRPGVFRRKPQDC